MNAVKLYILQSKTTGHLQSVVQRQSCDARTWFQPGLSKRSVRSGPLFKNRTFWRFFQKSKIIDDRYVWTAQNNLTTLHLLFLLHQTSFRHISYIFHNIFQKIHFEYWFLNMVFGPVPFGPVRSTFFFRCWTTLVSTV